MPQSSEHYADTSIKKKRIHTPLLLKTAVDKKIINEISVKSFSNLFFRFDHKLKPQSWSVSVVTGKIYEKMRTVCKLDELARLIETLHFFPCKYATSQLKAQTDKQSMASFD